MAGAERIQSLLVDVRRRWFAAVALRAIGLGSAVAAVPVLLAAIAYWLLRPAGGALLLLAAGAAALTLAGVVLIARRIERRPDDRRVARYIEERVEAQPGGLPMNDCLVSAVQAMTVPEGDPRAPFATLVLGAASRCLEDVTPATIIPAERLRRAAAIAAGGVLALLVVLSIASPALSHVAQTARLRLYPQSVVVEVVPGDVRLPAGQPLRIRARVQAGGDELTRLLPKLVVSAGGEQQLVEMAPAADGFEFAFESVDRTFQYKVAAGSVTSAEYTVTALFPPRVKRISLHYQYPSFSGLPARSEEDGGDIYAPAGTRVRMEIQADKPLASGELTLGQGRAALTTSTDQVLTASLVLSKDDSYRIRLTDRDGLRSDGDSEYFIRLMDDRPPDVRILRPAADQGITPLEEVAIEARAEDDYGVTSLELVFAVSGGKEHVVPFSKLEGGALQKTGQHLLAAEELKVRPGDVISYYARARDVGRGKRPTETKTDMFFLEVHPFNAEYEQAQSQAGAGGAAGDPQLESLIAAQKEIISATWNIERRSGAGRSDEDVKAIAQAQTDLKARVERALGAARGRRGRGFMPPQNVARQPPQTRPSTGDPVASAVAAMTRAIEQLSAARTRDAITHEMAALSALMEAQAEVRRRQVMQQQASGSGRGSNRQMQDLSALFDKELQRQQRTNYEQRSQVETRDEQQQEQTDQAALDRIRDLARRQEALNRQQRDLAGMSAEERKRQLEKLTRDQQELQRQAEELSRQLNQQQSGQQQAGQQQAGQQQAGQQQAGQQQAGQQRPGGQSPQGTSAMRDAVEQMRRAANDMRREEGESASQAGERAVEQLRRAEQQMRGTSGDARQRAAADLQAEAQQIAQEQQRIADEAGRLEKSGDGKAADAGRRLAADKDRLADRVENLRRDAQRLAESGGTGNEQGRAREAAAQLQRDRVDERMREGAEGLRKGAQPSRGAEQQVARTLDQVVEKLGGAASAAARQSAEQLEQNRQLREKLDTLQAQMKQAQASKKPGDGEKLQQQYEQALRQAKESLGRQTGGTDQRDGLGRATPEQQEFSRSAPGTEAFKQDRAEWESLRREVDDALEARDAAASRRLARAIGEDKLSGGGSERVPEQYRRLVAKYYESLAKTRK